MIAIIVTELLICIKFGWSTITKPLPRHIALWWVLGAALLLVYTVVKFYLLKPNHIPKPEKENIRMGSPVNSPTGNKKFPVELVEGEEAGDDYIIRREDKKDL